MRDVIRYNTLNLSEEDMKKELSMAIDFVRYALLVHGRIEVTSHRTLSVALVRH